MEKLTEAKWWHKEQNRVVCDLCPRYCRLWNAQAGFCHIRYNDNGIMRTMGREMISGLALDPIEKKPLYHVMPKKNILSFGSSGCSMGCFYCQNWNISKNTNFNINSYRVSTSEMIRKAYYHKQKSSNVGIAFTYNEPTINGEWIIDISKRARHNGLMTVMVTNGYITHKAVKDIYPFIDAANIDIKAFSEKFYYKITLSHLKPVLDAIQWIKSEGTWIELTNLLIPGYNDSETEIKSLSEWIIKYLGPNVPLHFSAFHPEFKMKNTEETPFSSLKKAFNIAREAGLNFVYTGNTFDQFTGSTYCKKCGKVMIRRNRYDVELKGLSGDKCKYCGYILPGIFNNN